MTVINVLDLGIPLVLLGCIIAAALYFNQAR